MKLSKTAVILFTFCGVGAFSVFTLRQSGGLIVNDNCDARLSESQIRAIVSSEMKTRQVVPNGISSSQLDDEKFGKIEIQINPDWQPNAEDEYSASMYLVQFSEAEFRFWALLSSCGQVNIAGSGNYKN